MKAQRSLPVTSFGELFKAVSDGLSKLRAPGDQYRALEAITQHCQLDGGITTERLTQLRAKVVLQHHLTRPIVNLMTLADVWVALQIPPAEIQDDERDYLVERCRRAQKAIGLYAELRNPNGIRKVVNELWGHARDAGAVKTPLPELSLPPQVPAKKAIEELKRQALRVTAGISEWARSPRPKEAVRHDKPRRKRGRPVDTDAKADQRLHDAWLSRSYRTYSELARELGKAEREVRQTIDRHRKRMERRGE